MYLLGYQDLNVWKACFELSLSVYKSTVKFPKEETYGLTSQMRRASVSTISNIAEGCGRIHLNDKLQFFYIARGSLFEVESQVLISLGIGLLSKEENDQIIEQITHCKRLLNGFIEYHKRKRKNK